MERSRGGGEEEWRGAGEEERRRSGEEQGRRGERATSATMACGGERWGKVTNLTSPSPHMTSPSPHLTLTSPHPHLTSPGLTLWSLSFLESRAMLHDITLPC